jgi:hypothetical protein
MLKLKVFMSSTSFLVDLCCLRERHGGEGFGVDLPVSDCRAFCYWLSPGTDNGTRRRRKRLLRTNNRPI